jgi:alpha 1,3-glucosidase
MQLSGQVFLSLSLFSFMLSSLLLLNISILGDNQARWEHLGVTSQMLLSLTMAGAPFVGADVGGYFDHPTPELHLRWFVFIHHIIIFFFFFFCRFQMGCLQPFFRQHAHHESPRREIYLIESPFREYMRNSVKLRYRVFF